MKNKFKYFLIFTALLSLMVVTACAEEAVPEPSAPITSDESVVTEEEGTSSGSLLDSGFYSTGPLTVDVSEQSVASIADAVVEASENVYQYAYQYSIPNGTGIITFDTNERYFLDDNKLTIGKDGNSYLCFALNYRQCTILSNGRFSFAPEANVTRTCGGVNLGYRLNTDYIISFDRPEDFFTTSYDVSVGGIVFREIIWSNQHVYNANTGELLFESDYVPTPPFTVSFSTGIDGLEFEPQGFRELVLPELDVDGSIFVGWYLDSDFNEIFTTSFNPTEDFTLYAKLVDEPPFGIIHQSIFEAFEVFLSCEPILYIMSLVGLVIFLGIGKSLVTSRL